MPTPQPIPLATTLGQPRSATVSLESLTNLYLEPNPGNARSGATLYGTPGLKPWLTVGTGPVRGVIRKNAHLWAVVGNELYEIDASKVATLVGVIEGAGNVHMTHNGTHIAVAVPGGKLYAANADGIVTLSQSGMCGAEYQDGYGVFVEQGNDNVWITNLDDMTTISGTDFTSADVSPDANRGIIRLNRELFVFGEETTEIFYNSGDADFPFVRTGGGFMEKGCRAPGSLARAENTAFWLGHDLGVYMASGYQPQPIAPAWVVRAIEATNDPGSAWGFTYSQQGRTFYVLSFSDLTIVYDVGTGAWHKRKSDGSDRWRVSCHAYYRGKHIVGDAEQGELYEMDLETYDENGATIRREIVTPPFHAQGSGVIMDELYLDMKMGAGLVSGQGSDPQVMLDWTEDDGATWSSEVWASAGRLGERKRRATWNRLGRFEHRTLRFAITDPIEVAINAAYARLTPLGG